MKTEYSKPQVTIDLEEYNELLKVKVFKEETKEDADNEALCILYATLKKLDRFGMVDNIGQHFKNIGIEFTVIETMEAPNFKIYTRKIKK